MTKQRLQIRCPGTSPGVGGEGARGAVGLPKELIVGSVKPQQCSRTDEKVVREFRKKF